MTLLRAVLERAFALLEHAVTAALYPYCLLRDRARGPTRVPILMYHQVGPRLEGVNGGDDRVDPARFARQMRAIADAGYDVVPLATLVDAVRNGRIRELGRAAVLTFDDGFRGQFVFAYPVLQRRRLPATFFVVAGSLGAESPLPHLAPPPSRRGPGAPPAWWPLSGDEIREMARAGIDIGSHAVTHRSLGLLSPAERRFEVRGSKEILEAESGARVDLFAYPFGAPAYHDCDAAAELDLAAAGYLGACTTSVGRAGAASDPLALPRLPIAEGDGPFRVRCKLAGAYDWVGPVKNLWQRLVPRLDRVDAAPDAAAPGHARTIP